MRIFQNSGVCPSYRAEFSRKTQHISSFADVKCAFLADRYGACHFLKPILDGDTAAFFTNGDDSNLQKKWAHEQGIPVSCSLEDILLAQIEHHRSEVFYNLDPMRYGSSFIRRLPGSVKYSVAWRAAPSPGADFSRYNIIVCNFPSILQSYEKIGWKSAYFSPAHDPFMDHFATNDDRPIDILFVGGYSRHHKQRAKILEIVAAQRKEFNIIFHLDSSRLTQLSESRLGYFLPLRHYRRPKDISMVSSEPVFGLNLYSAISRAKIVLNGAIDMAGRDRGNMRCFEAMGCGALMISDHGVYPRGMEVGKHFDIYNNSSDVVDVLKSALQNMDRSIEIASRGFNMLKDLYNKDRQWHLFQNIIGAL